ncbi:MAG: hypothetical protein ING66_09190 [Rhodocyclaceae bacterium]|nr:hypothetical protein [Rhodocyclaceae bacterium]MCA3025604.1 hypothetical protein [Rhodocyclaceae bacterium]MCA3028760.1 hypothetical protein [Rhodocyclaceae bacterium]MCA3032879.1 hypothetical protein [Rhodocyclaceae bacterium]MCA3037319.1 hypothetical protein [Rhodocyclaceae bacterium]
MLVSRIDSVANEDVRSIVEVVPYEYEVIPSVISTKLNDFLVLYEYEGIDRDGKPLPMIDVLTQQAENAINQADSRLTIFTSLQRNEATDYPEGYFSDKFSEILDDEWRKHLQLQGQFSNKHYIAFALASRQSGSGFVQRFKGKISAGVGLVASMKHAFRTSFSEQHMAEAYASSAIDDATYLRDAAQLVIAGIPGISATRLEGDMLRGALASMCSPASRIRLLVAPPDGVMLDGYLPHDEIDFPTPRLLSFTSAISSKYAAALTLKHWVPTAPGIMDALMSLPCEITVTQTLKLLDRESGKSYIEKIRDDNRMRMYSFRSVMAAKINRQSLDETRDADEDRKVAIDEANEAIGDMRAANRLYGYLNFTMLIYGDSPEAVEANVLLVAETIKARNFAFVREGLGLLGAFKATLPGMHHHIKRWQFASTGNYADMIFTRTVGEGDRLVAYFEEQTRQPAPALLLVPTDKDTPYWYSPLVEQVGHSITFGPNGTGKSIWTNFQKLQFGRYPSHRTVTFDMDYSSYIPTVLANGKHIDLKTGDVQLCPWKLVADRRNLAWLARFTESLLTSRTGTLLSSEGSNQVMQALRGLADMDIDDVHIESLHDSLPSQELRSELEPWMPGQLYGDLFGSTIDTFALSQHTCIEMGAFLKDAIAAPRLVEYFSYRIESTLDLSAVPTPTMIDIQESGTFLRDPVFQKEAQGWLERLRKKVAFVNLSMQSVQSVAFEGIFTAIGDNVKTRIFLPNEQAATPEWAALYNQKLGLTQEQVDRIATARKFRDYYLVRERISRMFMFSPPPTVLAAIRSDKRALKLCRDLLPADPTKRAAFDWKQQYIETLANER